MFKKDTEKLLAEIKSDGDIKKFLNRNENELVKPLHVYLNELLQAKNLNKVQIIKNSLINVNYGYHIFEGKKKIPHGTNLFLLGLL